jgi:ATP-binding cassette subfamily F protein 3
MLHLTDIVVRLGGRPILDGACLHLPAGHRYGLVGRNGAGKSTLLRLIAGVLEPDAGELRLARNLRIGTVAQEAPGGDATPLDVVLAGDRERHALLSEAEVTDDPHRIGEVHTRLAEIDAHTAPIRAARILEGLGFDEAAQERPLSSFSGGWRMRVALGAALFAEPDLLLLDEPTNHLDLEASLWLEDYLRAWPRTLLLVSHDRDLLNRVPERIVHLEAGRTAVWLGNLDRFLRQRREQRERLAKEAAAVDARRKHIQAFVDRFRYKATKARQAQSRLKALARLEPIVLPEEAGAVRFEFAAGEVPAPPLITLDRVAVGYGGAPVLSGLELRLDPDDRIALLGANGNGKSTFAKLIAGRLDAQDGELVRAPKLRVGFFAQHQIEDLDPGATPLTHLERLLRQAPERELRARLARFGLGVDQAGQTAAVLSGGEKARLCFALMAARDPQLLILDEPTNHLDLESREALIEALGGFPGAVILISHDPHLIEHAADRLWLVAGGRVRPYEGDLDDYRTLLLGRSDETVRPNGGPRPRGGQRRSRVAELRRVARDAETELERLAREKAAIDRSLADPAAYADPARAAELAKQGATLNAALGAAEQRWLQAEEALQAAAD